MVSENSTGNVGSPLRATDDDGDILTYSIAEGDDNASFEVDRATGQLTVRPVNGLDFEAPADADTENDYVVMVKATDSHGIGTAVDVTVTITVNDVNEVPTFTAGDEGMAADHPEDLPEAPAADLVISTYTATDPEEGEVTLSAEGRRLRHIRTERP